MIVTDEMVRAGALALNARTGGNDARFKHMQEVYMAEARAALTAALAAMQDHVIVPKEPTGEMLAAAYHLAADVFPAVHGPRALYLAMIAAAQLSTRTNERDDARNLSGVSSE